MTANEQYLDAVIRHQIGLLRLAQAITKLGINDLNSSERELADRLRHILRRLPRRGATPRQIRQIREIVTEIRRPAWKKIGADLRRELRSLVKSEVDFHIMAARTVHPQQLDLTRPDISVVQALALGAAMNGRTITEWLRRTQANDINAIVTALQLGLSQNEADDLILRRVVGTSRQRGRNGVVETARRQLTTLTRSSVIHAGTQATRQLYDANDLWDKELYVATLDSRTTPICRSLDGQIFPKDEGYFPPLHFNCRSRRVGVMDDEIRGTRPFVAATERGLLKQYVAQNGLRRGITKRSQLPRGHRGRFDVFRSREARKLVGQIPAHVNYEQFLRRQSVSFQDEVLGVTKARLFRRGGLTLDRFVDRNFKEFTLADLARSDAEAFRRAGLDPDDFL